MKIVECEGTINVVDVPMDDYIMVLGMEFLDGVRHSKITIPCISLKVQSFILYL